MPRFFNTSGPNMLADHYTLPAMRRLPGVRGLIDKKLYFVLHAPRQTGKTTALMTLARELTEEGRYLGAYVTMEVGAAFPRDVGKAELAVLASWRSATRSHLPASLQPPPWPDAPAGQRIGAALEAWSQQSSRPLVVFLDEIDALRDQPLISVLRQLRSGYSQRPARFPWSLALIGLRDVRDYKVISGERERLGSSSPFNIKAESLTMRNFSRDEVAELYAQHTSETGQLFAADAVDRVYELSQGQPWLVNAMAQQLTEVLVTERSESIVAVDVNRAKDILIARQDTHLDSLAERLVEPRIRSIIEPMLAGDSMQAVPKDDRRFAVDLGLLRHREDGGLDMANPIYREIIALELASGARDSLPQISVTWLTKEGRLDERALLQAFLAFWRQHGEPLLSSVPYHEVAPQLVLLAFLHRVVNGGGSIEREYAIGRGRMDLCVRYGDVTLAIELKVWRQGRPEPLQQGLEQIDVYMSGLGLDSGWLVIFDKRDGLPPVSERLKVTETTTPDGRAVTLVRA